ncbi:MAG: carbohydrate binding family 9 domain-containing protein [Polaribacter sp.]|nr:carbohydrate binding family 9 domain-containing protein [Polaribacter sp.]
MKFVFNYLLVFLFCSTISFSQEVLTNKIPKRVYTTKKLTKTPVIDGDVTDEAWNVVEWSSEFTEKEPDEGTPPTYQTLFKVIYDSKYLYIAIKALDDQPELIQKRLSRRDGFAGDRVNVIIDSYHDKRTAFVFTTTAAGVKGEEIATQNGQSWDESWNPVWFTDAKVDDKGWTAEMKIPFSQLRFGKSKEQVWGFNINRNIFRLNERSLWQRIPNDQAGFISEAGELHGLIDLPSQKQLEIQPFTLLQYDSYPKEGNNPYRDGSDFKANIGLDAKIGVTNDLTLDLTINPDFGQVEADPGAIALDGFQLFFREQRPFFVENKNIFDFQFANGSDNLFYSRRIGRNPHRSANLTSDEFADEPLNSAILGAAKFSGKTKNGWSIGILESVTANEFAEIKQTNGNTRQEIVEPLTNYFVGRAQKDFNERNSFIGGIFTATNRNLNGNFNELHKAAYSGGIDFQHNWKNREYFLDGNVIMSHVLGSAEAIENTQRSITRLFQRTDATHVNVDPTRTSLTGTGGRIELGKAGGGNWRYNGGFIWRSPELELNDVGFLRNTDQMIQFANLRYLWQVPTKTYRNASIEASQVTEYDFQKNLNRIRFEGEGNINWANNATTNLGLGTSFRSYSNAFLRGGPRWRTANNRYVFGSFGSDRSKIFSYNMRFTFVDSDENVFKRQRYSIGFNYQPTDALNISLENQLELTQDRAQYVTSLDFGNDKRYILGNINNDEFSTTLRFTYSINPNMSIQFYGQPFISRGRYSEFKFVNTAAADRFTDRVTIYDTNQISTGTNVYTIDENSDNTIDYQFNKPDFSFAQFRSNLVARWEYIPGSEIFLVWAQGVVGNENPDASLSTSLSNQVFSQRKENTFLLKVTYRFVR